MQHHQTSPPSVTPVTHKPRPARESWMRVCFHWKAQAIRDLQEAAQSPPLSPVPTASAQNFGGFFRRPAQHELRPLPRTRRAGRRPAAPPHRLAAHGRAAGGRFTLLAADLAKPAERKSRAFLCRHARSSARVQPVRTDDAELLRRPWPAGPAIFPRVVMTGAEKLPDRLATAFEEQFGIRPLEGYGCTECAPAVAVNTLDFRSAGFRQVGGKRGKIGHPLPGISVRIVDPETQAPLAAGQPGLLLVRGPNVMLGYLGRPEKTAEVLRDGWYGTGDVAAIDEDGFLQITDRLSRFSKIGGEMVPHIKVEEKLHELAGVTEQTFVVTGVTDEKKGERLVVLHKLADGQLLSCLEKLAQCDLPNLWKPRADQFFRVGNFPLLGTGKLDLRKVREMGVQLAATTEKQGLV